MTWGNCRGVNHKGGSIVMHRRRIAEYAMVRHVMQYETLALDQNGVCDEIEFCGIGYGCLGRFAATWWIFSP